MQVGRSVGVQFWSAFRAKARDVTAWDQILLSCMTKKIVKASEQSNPAASQEDEKTTKVVGRVERGCVYCCG